MTEKICPIMTRPLGYGYTTDIECRTDCKAYDERVPDTHCLLIRPLEGA